MMADGSASCFSAILLWFSCSAQTVWGQNILPCQRRPYHGMNSGRSQVIHHSIKMLKHTGFHSIWFVASCSVELVKTVSLNLVKVGNAHLPYLSFFLSSVGALATDSKSMQGSSVNQIQIQMVCVKPLQALLTGLFYPVVSCVIISKSALFENTGFDTSGFCFE